MLLNLKQFEGWRIQANLFNHLLSHLIGCLGTESFLFELFCYSVFLSGICSSILHYFLKLSKKWRQHPYSPNPNPDSHCRISFMAPSAFPSLLTARYFLQSRVFLLGWQPSWSRASLKFPSSNHEDGLVASELVTIWSLLLPVVFINKIVKIGGFWR